ncbi:baculoviral IAP repeat-containing protein 5 [Dermacentor silvarum]|uniref:baculoviral IAP repeat-containing protein 5 n=1 Tax=Dermacentor silvarum TaxID=543639 RepID=UPI001898F3BB|nr:baculoviral IAP repeat-containing protein 5 [Dermacentor silvarum]
MNLKTWHWSAFEERVHERERFVTVFSNPPFSKSGAVPSEVQEHGLRLALPGQLDIMVKTTKPSADLSLKSVLLAQTDRDMHHVENRVASFKHWPLTGDCMCTPARMAAAGFYHCPTDNEPDLARCYVCLKELDGWEPNDDPFKEHSRSANCAFVRLGKKAEDITALDFLNLEKARARNKAQKYIEVQKAELGEDMRKVKYELDKVRRKKR